MKHSILPWFSARFKNSKISVTFEGEYILVKLTGDNSYEVSLNLWKKVIEACEKNQCFNILGVSNTNKPLKTMEAFDHINIFTEVGITQKHRIAWVEKNPEAAETFKFVETVIKNRGLGNGYLFSDISEAKNWLLGNNEEV